MRTGALPCAPSLHGLLGKVRGRLGRVLEESQGLP